MSLTDHSVVDGLVPSVTDKALHIEDLFKRYPTGVEALRGVSLEIEPGEFFGLLGPNGAGKSTLIHCATGLAQPTSGTIRVFGHDAMRGLQRESHATGLDSGCVYGRELTGLWLPEHRLVSVKAHRVWQPVDSG